MGSLYESFQTPAPSRKDMQRIGMAKTSAEQRKAFADTLQQSPKGRLAMAFEPVEDQGHGKRPDGTAKGLGFFGELPIKGGGVATEYSVGVQLEGLGGKETDIPSLVPTLTKKERDLLLNDIIPNKKPIPDTIVQKAVDHANKRVKEGKNVFFQEGEDAFPGGGGGGKFRGRGASGSFDPVDGIKGRIAEAGRAITRGTANVASGFQETRARLLQLGGEHPITEPHFGMQTKKQRAALDKRAEKLHKDSQLLWNVARQPELMARNKDLADKAINLIGETIPYITATTAAYIVAGPMGGFTVGNMVEGNSAYRTAQDHFKEQNKGKPLTKAQEKQSKNIGIAVGLVSGAVESFGGVGAEKLIRLATDKIKSKLAKAGAVFATGMVVEALEEGAQELAAITGEKTYRDVSWKEAVTRTGGAMAGGAFLGGSFKAASFGGRGLLGLTQEAAVEQIEDRVRKEFRGIGPETDVARPEPPLLGAEGITVTPQPPIQAVTPAEPTITPEGEEIVAPAEGEVSKESIWKTETTEQAKDLGFTQGDRAAIAFIEHEGGQVNISGVPLEDWFTYTTPEGLIIQSDTEIVGKGGYAELRAKADEWLTPTPPTKAEAKPKKGTVAEKRARLAEAAKGPITKEERQKLQDAGMTVKEIGETPAEELRARLILSGETLEGPAKKPGDEPSGGVAWHTAITQALEKMPIIQRAIRRQQKISLKKRVGAAAGTLKGLRKKGLSAQEAIARSTGKLKGQQANYTQLYPQLDAVVEPWIVESAYNDIADTDRIQYFDRVGLTNRNGTGAFDKLVAGTALTPGEVTLIKRWMPEIGVLAEQRVPFSTKAWNTFIQVINIPRSTLAGFADLSGIGRQQRALGMANIRKYVHAIHATHRAFFSGKFTDNLQKEYENSDFYDEAKEIAGVDFSAHAREATELSEQEEEFVAAPMLEQIPGLGRVFKATERAFVVPLNWLRMQVYEAARIGNANMTESQMKVLGNAINDLSGRSSVGRANAAKKISVLMTAFFSPRFALSRIKLPYTMGRATFESIRNKELKKDVKALVTGETRGAFQVVGRSMALMIAGNFALMFLLKMLWPEDTEIDLDLKSSDGGKVKIGNKRIDLWSGYLQPAQLFWRLATGQRKSQAGRLYDVDVRDTLESFARSKTSPIVGLAIDLWRGKTFFGEKLGAAPRGKVGEFLTEKGVPKSVQGISKELYNRMAPLTAQDFSDALVDTGIPAALGMGALGFYGTGVQTYENWPAAKLQIARNQAAIEKHGKPWDDLKHIEQKRLKKEPALKEIEDQTIEERRKMGSGDYGKYIEKPLNDSAKRMMKQLPDNLQTELELLDMTPGGVKRTISSDFVLNDKRYEAYEQYTVENIKRLLTPRIKANSWQTREYLSRLNVAQEKIIDAKAQARKRVLREINQGKL